mmetsp:Transcript_35297/g.92305  ORF Transcript_35297/g.92305 Transcript_35297/m.92305 type:complete len:116 (-) Transcript_35297:173-520(-)|eukprot:CAMPEP_0182925750 /NCGR_PEP_ID=MMETSP0105_2-20130417/10317_1 /TAXON_ID=81532 ORGANISM="Acanthoeca-like sp., Strain 10tr" /NCGR_SAMPLE_ID=MMETSP0105_2 /ASSEMBLY_ACC=CAM_ASM_000205 /LENGTH=115 /DNA_ID=CAMNT_0025063609 /DNA_START=24 /DNA_END=371 /DNA_ORIENTATION=+
MDSRIEELVEAFESDLAVEETADFAPADDIAAETDVIVNEDDDDDDDDEDDIEDPAVKLREECEHHCPAVKARLDACTERVEGRGNTAETCIEELQDFLHCIDHCLVEKLFKELK